MSSPEIKRAIAKLPRHRSATRQSRPKSAFRRKTALKNSLALNPLVAACLAANKDPALCHEIESWQGFDDTPAHS
jgi:hypothetical protein